MAQMYSWLKTLYGDSDDFNWSQFGLPQDKVRNPMNKFVEKYENEFDLEILTFPPPVRPRRPHHHGADPGSLQGGEVYQRLLRQR